MDIQDSFMQILFQSEVDLPLCSFDLLDELADETAVVSDFLESMVWYFSASVGAGFELCGLGDYFVGEIAHVEVELLKSDAS